MTTGAHVKQAHARHRPIPEPQVESARPAAGVPPFPLPRGSVLAGSLVGLLATIVMCVRDHGVFSTPIHEDTDYAANSILVNQAVHFQLLIGNYSREGFNHPGPAFLYIQSFGQDLFYSLLHIVPSQYNGQLLAVFVLSGAMIALTMMVLSRRAGSWLVALFGFGAILLLTGSSVGWASAWMPYVYVAPFLLAVVAGASVATGALEDLPFFILAVCLLVHGHIAFVGIMGLYVIVVAATWFVVVRRWDRPWNALRVGSRQLAVSAAIVFIFLVPIALELILHWPGELTLYWHYIHGNGQQNPHTPIEALRYVKQFWPGGDVGIALLLLGAVAAAVLAARDPDRGRRFFTFGVLGAVVVISIEVAVYGLKGVDQLSLVYTGYFYYAIPPLLLTVLVMEVGSTLRTVAAVRLSAHQRKRSAQAIAAVAFVALLLVLVSQTSFYNPYRGDPNLPAMASALQHDSAQKHEGVAIDLGVVGAPTSDWPDVVGLLIAASRSGYEPCVDNPLWAFMMTSSYICTPSEAAHRWKITVSSQSQPAPVPAGSVAIFHDPTTVVYSG